MKSTPVARCINEVLPEELLGVIFEEHAKLEWRAPVIDELVCKQWQQTILRSHRAWAHLEIGLIFENAPSKLRQWLDRSGTAPLHIKVNSLQGLEEIVYQHHKRFESLTVRHSLAQAMLNHRSFPTLQSLTICDWDRGNSFKVFDWGIHDAIPALRSLRVGHIRVAALPSDTFPPLRFLTLHGVVGFESIILNTSHSLSTIMLYGVHLTNTSETLEFPSLTFLSLYAVTNLKHRMNVPALTTYHEGAGTEDESFTMPLPSLMEYGIDQGRIKRPFNVERLQQCYPNISRFSVRAGPPTVKEIVHSLSNQPTSLPKLGLLAVGVPYGEKEYEIEDKDSMMNDVLVRNTAADVKIELCFDGKLRVPLYFGIVRVYIKEGRSTLTSTLRTWTVEGHSFVSSNMRPKQSISNDVTTPTTPQPTPTSQSRSAPSCYELLGCAYPKVVLRVEDDLGDGFATIGNPYDAWAILETRRQSGIQAVINAELMLAQRDGQTPIIIFRDHTI